MSAGRGSENLNLADERARLAKAQTTKIFFDLKIGRGLFVSRQAAYLETSASFAAVRAKLLAVPHRVKSEIPSIPNKAIVSLDRIISECLRDLAETKLSADLLERVKAVDDEDFARIETVDGGVESQTARVASGKEKSRKA